MAVFAISPAAKYYLHEMGYYEQYGYLFIIIMCYVCNKYSKLTTYIIPATASFVAIFISESNAFLVVPVIAAFSFMSIMDRDSDRTEKIRNCLVLLATYVPHLLYCIFIWIYRVPESTVYALQDHDRMMVNETFSYPNFYFREDAHLFMGSGRLQRSQDEIWKIRPHRMHIWCLALIAIMVLFVMYFMYMKNVSNRMILSYLIMSVFTGGAGYSICLLAWDLERFYFNAYMSVFLLSVFVARKYLKQTKITHSLSLVILIVFISSMGMSKNRFGLFDYARYNETWPMFVESWNAKSLAR